MKKINVGTDKRCVFIGGKQIGVNCLKQLLAHGVIPLIIIANLDDEGKESWHESLVACAIKNNIPVLKKTKINSSNTINTIKKLSPEIIFCIGGTQLIPEAVLKIPPQGTINIHPALLPKYRGRYSTPHALFNGEKKTGVTMHFMDEKLDSGPIISQKIIPINKTDTAKSLYDKFTDIGEALFIQFLSDWLKGKKISKKPQNEKKASYYPKGLPNNGEIDWTWSGKKIYNFIRAMTFEPFPPVSFKIGNKKMIIVDEKYLKKF